MYRGKKGAPLENPQKYKRKDFSYFREEECWGTEERGFLRCAGGVSKGRVLKKI